MWESAGNGGMCDVSSCTTLIVCHNSPLLRSRCLYIYLQLTLNMIHDVNHFPVCAEGSEEKNCNITGKIASAVVCGSWHC